LLQKSNDKERSEILSFLNSLVTKLVEDYEVQQTQSGFGLYVFALDIFGVHDKETRISNMLSFALQAIQDFKKLKEMNNIPFEIVIGVHDGPGVFSIKQGVETNRKSRYLVDLFGDAVNKSISALRKGKVNQIITTSSVYEEVKEDFEFVKMDEFFQLKFD
jgi:hypothetical protein